MNILDIAASAALEALCSILYFGINIARGAWIWVG